MFLVPGRDHHIDVRRGSDRCVELNVHSQPEGSPGELRGRDRRAAVAWPRCPEGIGLVGLPDEGRFKRGRRLLSMETPHVFEIVSAAVAMRACHSEDPSVLPTDFSDAHSSVDHWWIFIVLQRAAIPEPLQAFLREIYTSATAHFVSFLHLFQKSYA